MTFEITCLNDTYKCRYFTLDEYEKIILAKIENNLQEAIKNILHSCVEGYSDTLSKTESELLLIKLWAHSLGEVNQEKEYICECGKTHNVCINYNYITIPELSGFLYNTSNVKLKMRYPRLFEDTDRVEMVVSCIEGLILEDGQEIKIEDLSENELDDLYSILSKEVIDILKEELLKPEVVLGIPIDCECSPIKISGLAEFLKVIG